MIAKLRHHWQEMRASYWFLPTVCVVAAVALAIILIAVDASVELHMAKRWPLIFGAGADGARGLLAAVASSMITVAGVVFSITIVALALTASQYTSSVLRNFMRDRTNQIVLGVFVGTFAYCVVVLRTIRGGDEGAFVPSLAVMGGLVLAFVGIGFLIFFIHHISVSIQASSIVAEAARETMAAVDRLFPQELGRGADDDAHRDAAMTLPRQDWSVVPARKTGYLQSVNGEAMLALARERQVVVRMEHCIGEFVVEGAALVSVAGGKGVDDEMVAALNAVHFIERQRTLEQDAAFGIRQIVDIAMKALSPGINDSTTAIMCVDYLGAILTMIAGRTMPSVYRLDEAGALRVVVRSASFESTLAEAFDQIRQNAQGNAAVLLRQLKALEIIAGRTASAAGRQALRHHVEMICEAAERTVLAKHDCSSIGACASRLRMLLHG